MSRNNSKFLDLVTKALGGETAAEIRAKVEAEAKHREARAIWDVATRGMPALSGGRLRYGVSGKGVGWEAVRRCHYCGRIFQDGELGGDCRGCGAPVNFDLTGNEAF